MAVKKKNNKQKKEENIDEKPEKNKEKKKPEKETREKEHKHQEQKEKEQKEKEQKIEDKEELEIDKESFISEAPTAGTNTGTSFSLPEEEREIEEILGISVPSKERLNQEQTQIQERQTRQRQETYQRMNQEEKGISYSSTTEQPFYGSTTEYQSSNYENTSYSSSQGTSISEGGLERMIPLSKDLQKNRKDNEPELITSFDERLTPVEELFLNPIGDSYIQEQEKIRKKRKIK
ncbi:MAG: hypothetical protein KJ767_00325 [Nanoarchaeota archaeon]|nr:hypothetical protein [Nanoarchaeota archaeon]